MTRKSLVSQIDTGFLFLLVLLAVFGWSVLWSACHEAGGEVAPYAFRQLRWLAVGAAALAAVAALDYRHFQTYAWPLYCGLTALLVVVLVAGKISMGAQRWLSLGPLRLQPSEFMKIGVALALACLFSREGESPPYGIRALLLPALVVAVPVGLILLQPDLGTGLLLVGVAATIVLFQGVRPRVIAWGAGFLLAMAPAGWALLREYQRQRILTFLAPERDPLGAGYHIIQSKIAVGSGQLLGKGFLQSTQARLQFLPERHTDFIFSVLAEEWGLVGCCVVLTLYALLVLWGLDIAAKARDTFGRLLAVGVTSILFFHVIVNVGMVTGVLPVVGVPLPLFSYGGSSVLTTCLVAGILVNIRMRRFSRGL